MSVRLRVSCFVRHHASAVFLRCRSPLILLPHAISVSLGFLMTCSLYSLSSLSLLAARIDQGVPAARKIGGSACPSLHQGGCSVYLETAVHVFLQPLWLMLALGCFVSRDEEDVTRWTLGRDLPSGALPPTADRMTPQSSSSNKVIAR